MGLTATPLASLPPAPRLMPGPAPAIGTNSEPTTTPAHAGERSRQDGTNDCSARQGRAQRDGRGSADEQRMLAELKDRDREVRNHENAHRAGGGDLVRGGSYDYQQGPDGKRYAIGGDVQIDTTPVADDPSATAEKMAQVIRAALAPAQPSSTDLAVAAQASAERNRALAESARAPAEDSRPAEAGERAGGPAAAYRQVAEQSAGGANRVSAEA